MKIIQVPMEEAEVRELTGVARRMKTSRADLIRRACRSYLKALEEEALDLQYEQGYRDHPEEEAFGAVSAELLSARLACEGAWNEEG